MVSSPQSPPLESASSMSLSPQAVRPSPTTAAMATYAVRRRPRAMLLPFLAPRPSRRVLYLMSSLPVPGRGVARDPGEHEPERGDGDAGREPLAEQLVLGEPGDHDVAQAAAADHAADDHHRQHVEQALVGGEHQRFAGHRE